MVVAELVRVADEDHLPFTLLHEMEQLREVVGSRHTRLVQDHHCPVVEFGLVGQTMHKVDENVPLADILALTQIYRGIIERYFAIS